MNRTGPLPIVVALLVTFACVGCARIITGAISDDARKTALSPVVSHNESNQAQRAPSMFSPALSFPVPTVATPAQAERSAAAADLAAARSALTAAEKRAAASEASEREERRRAKEAASEARRERIAAIAAWSAGLATLGLFVCAFGAALTTLTRPLFLRCGVACAVCIALGVTVPAVLPFLPWAVLALALTGGAFAVHYLRHHERSAS